jgi:hypothetical protein
MKTLNRLNLAPTREPLSISAKVDWTKFSIDDPTASTEDAIAGVLDRHKPGKGDVVVWRAGMAAAVIRDLGDRLDVLRFPESRGSHVVCEEPIGDSIPRLRPSGRRRSFWLSYVDADDQIECSLNGAINAVLAFTHLGEMRDNAIWDGRRLAAIVLDHGSRVQIIRLLP